MYTFTASPQFKKKSTFLKITSIVLLWSIIQKQKTQMTQGKRVLTITIASHPDDTWVVTSVPTGKRGGGGCPGHQERGCATSAGEWLLGGPCNENGLRGRNFPPLHNSLLVLEQYGGANNECPPLIDHSMVIISYII